MAFPHPYLTPEEYVARERAAEHRSEYYAGDLFAMAGAKEQHNLIAGNVLGEIRARFKGRPCRVYPGDMRVKVSETGLYTYPDVVALCGAPQFEDEERDTLLNPAVVIEVPSPTTEAYDRDTKFAHYRRITSLREYGLISQDRVRVERYVRQEDGEQWLYSETRDPAAALHLVSIDCHVPLAEIYDKVEFRPAEGASRPLKPGGP